MPWSRMVSTELSDDEKLDAFRPPIMDKGPDYPPGLCICFDQGTLEKLDLEADCEIGDLIDLRCMAQVTSVSKRAGPNGDDNARVELQIIAIAAEDEAREDKDDDDDD